MLLIVVLAVGCPSGLKRSVPCREARERQVCVSTRSEHWTVDEFWRQQKNAVCRAAVSRPMVLDMRCTVGRGQQGLRRREAWRCESSLRAEGRSTTFATPAFPNVVGTELAPETLNVCTFGGAISAPRARGCRKG